MDLFGLTITRTKAVSPGPLARLESGRSWQTLIHEAFPGAWQQNIETPLVDVLRHSTVFACNSLISYDIAKMGIRLMERIASTGIWSETESPSFSPVLRKPNHYQTRIQFFVVWVLSKLIHGNAYILKQRDQRGVVTALYPLDATRVTPLVSPAGAVFYELKKDPLSQLPGNSVIVPAREIIHDINLPLYHPLIGTSTISACALAATQGKWIQESMTALFANGARPSGILTVPGVITETDAADTLVKWKAKFSGANAGDVAILSGGMTFNPLVMNAVDAQLIDQLNWTAGNICDAYRVPHYMVGIGDAPSYANIEAQNQQYYSQCLQEKIEAIELLLDEGLELPKPYGVEFDLDDLLRMDSATMMETIQKGVNAGVMKPNEGRAKLNLPPVPGGDTPYMQQQMYSLEALNKRDLLLPASGGTARPPAGGPPMLEDEDAEDEDADFDDTKFLGALTRALASHAT